MRMTDPHVSRLHAEIVRDGASYRIIDHQSKSGTFVNGERIQSHTLRHGDHILFGGSSDHAITFLAEGEAHPSHPGLLSVVSTSSGTRDSQGDLQQVSRFLQGVRHFSTGVPLQEVLDVVLDMAVEISGADRAFLILLDANNQPSLRCGRNRGKESLQADQFQISRTILQEVLEKGQGVVITEASDPGAFSEFQSAGTLGLRAIVCLPLRGMDAGGAPSSAGREVIGALYMDSKMATKGLSSISEGLLESLANDASAVLVNMRLLKEAREKELLEMELGTAREIQESLLPEICGSYGFFEACAENRPSRRVSGDYYDLIPLPDQRYALVIADVSGKGIPAAILTSLVQGALFVKVSENSDLVSCIENLNRFLVHRSKPERFVSLFLATLDPRGSMRYVNAGHNPPLLVRASGEIVDLEARGLVLGVMEEAVFEEKTVTLHPGDVVCLYTDGVTEAPNANREFFGEERLRETLERGPRGSAASVLDIVLRAVMEFTGDTPRMDDLTLLVVRRL